MNSTKQQFKWNNNRIVVYSIMPFLCLIILTYYFLFAEHKNGIQPYFMTGFLLTPILVYCLLLFKHRANYGKQLLVLSDDQLICLDKEVICHQFFFTEIDFITEYSTNRFPWSRLCIWEFTLKDGRKMKISSVLITKSSFEKYFTIDNSKPSLFPY